MEISSANSALLTGVQGIQKGQQKLNAAASEIASSQSTSDLTEPAVKLLEGELEVKANAKSVEAASDTLGTLLDIRA